MRDASLFTTFSPFPSHSPQSLLSLFAARNLYPCQLALELCDDCPSYITITGLTAFTGANYRASYECPLVQLRRFFFDAYLFAFVVKIKLGTLLILRHLYTACTIANKAPEHNG